MSFVKDLLKHIESEDRVPKPYNRPDDFQERMLSTRSPRSYPREESLNQKWLKEIERQDRIQKPLNNIPVFQGDIEELIKNLDLELKGNPPAYIKKRKSRRGSRTSKRKTSRKRGSKRRTSKRKTSRK